MSSASSFSRASSSRVSELPLAKCPFCKADSIVVERICKKEENFNCKFYRCLTGQYTSGQCKFFMWQGDYAVWLVKEGFLHGWTNCIAHRTEDDVPESAKASLKGVNDGIEKIRCEMKEAISTICMIGIVFVTAFAMFVTDWDCV
uniref:GRF-type domain-containing protein n=1 Tax=Oryza barthii TaxID=65489 RepID=A0A0D3GI58_9ORYZ